MFSGDVTISNFVGEKGEKSAMGIGNTLSDRCKCKVKSHALS